MAYKKTLQLFRSTNTWPTKNIAKAMVEINAKHLHEIPEVAELKDGEPIVARYYDTLTNYTFSYGVGSSTNPYAGTYSATHIWVPGFDELTSMPDPADVNAESAGVIKVTINGTTTFYTLTATPGSGATATGISSIFGIAFVGTEGGTTKTYIEWFDSAADAQGIIDGLNYVDNNVGYDFVAKVNQKNGKIEPIHGTISSKQAIKLTESSYAYLRIGGTAPSGFEPSATTEGTSLPNASSADAPRYFHLTTTSGGNTAGYYELRKDIDIHLEIADENNVLAQGPFYYPISKEELIRRGVEISRIPSVEEVPEYPDEHADQYIKCEDLFYELKDNRGIGTHFTLRELTAEEIAIEPDASNIRDAYKLVGNANGRETQIGVTIKTYKDQSLYKVYLGHVDDQINESTGVITPGTGNDALCFVYKIADGTYSLVAVDVEAFLMENEFKDGLEIIRGSYSYKQIDYVPEGVTWNSSNSGPSLPANPGANSPEYYKVTTATPKYYKLSSNGTVRVKLSNVGGLTFYNEGSGVNQSVGIKLDPNNTFFREAVSGETATYTRYNMYEWASEDGRSFTYTSTPNPRVDDVPYKTDETHLIFGEDSQRKVSEVKNGYFTDGVIKLSNGETIYYPTGNIYDGYFQGGQTPTYVLATYLYVNRNGLGVDATTLDNRIVNIVQDKLRVNGQGFEYINGKLETVITGGDIKVIEDDDILPTIRETSTLSNLNKGIYSYNGHIYISDGTNVHALSDNDMPNLTTAEVEMINLYLNYNLDMGTYTVH